jgi:tetratricopeptide (TPR) repeat protein
MKIKLNHKSMILASLAVILLTTASGCNRPGNDTDTQLEKAKKLIEQGNYEEAFMQLNHILAEAPQDPKVHLNLGWLYLYTDDPEHANTEWEKANKLAPDLAEVYHLKGALLSYQAQHEQESNPQASKEDYEGAVDLYNAALQKDPNNHQLYFDKANNLSALERNQEALDTLNKGFDHIPKKDLETQVNFQIATCAAEAKLQMYQDAIDDCRQAEEFTTSPTSRQRIEDMIENMKLMNPNLNTSETPEIPSAEGHTPGATPSGEDTSPANDESGSD